MTEWCPSLLWLGIYTISSVILRVKEFIHTSKHPTTAHSTFFIEANYLLRKNVEATGKNKIFNKSLWPTSPTKLSVWLSMCWVLICTLQPKRMFVLSTHSIPIYVDLPFSLFELVARVEQVRSAHTIEISYHVYSICSEWFDLVVKPLRLSTRSTSPLKESADLKLGEIHA